MVTSGIECFEILTCCPQGSCLCHFICTGLAQRLSKSYKCSRNYIVPHVDDTLILEGSGARQGLENKNN